MKSRAVAEGWDATKSMDAAVIGGQNFNKYQTVRNIAAFTKVGAPLAFNGLKSYDDVFSLFGEKFDFASKFYSLFHINGSLQDAILNPQIKENSNEMGFFENIKYQFMKGIDQTNQFLSHPNFGH